MLFYEAPHKLTATLADLRETFGPERRIALCRELTKLHEEVRRTTLGEAADWYAVNPPKGEFVLVVEGASPKEKVETTAGQALELVTALRKEGYSLRDAVRQVSKETGVGKNELYDLAVEQGC